MQSGCGTKTPESLGAGNNLSIFTAVSLSPKLLGLNQKSPSESKQAVESSTT